MANDGPAHFLSLKVMRVSRPELASAWQPFYSSSPSFSAHSSAHVLSLQGSAPLPGHPKTLRDLTHTSELLTLPATFGAIQLGETFSSCLCVNNEAQIDIEVVQVKVEMQTVTAKVTLSEMDGAGRVLAAGDVLENVVHHEIKELGQHVLACAVTYRLPPNARPIPGAGEDANDPSLVTFRKFYKFPVTNPLSVKTKVHATRSPTALLSLAERDKVFLEVHIQNTTQQLMHFERMRFEPTDSWNVQEANYTSDTDATSIFAGALAVMQPQDIRQYLYILAPKTTSVVPPTLASGSIIPLGRLDIAWRSPFGEPGHLITSMLTRRIPFPTAPAPVSAVPPHLKRAIAGSTSRPQSPSISARPISPPPSQRPGSPYRPRAGSTVSQIGSASARAQSPQLPPLSTAPSLAPQSDLDVNLVVTNFPHNVIKVETPFTVSMQLVVSSAMPLRDFGKRKLAFAVQHLQVPKATQVAPLAVVKPPAEALSPRISSSGFSTPSSGNPSSFNYALAHQKILDAAAQRSSSPEGTIHGVDLSDAPDPTLPVLPPPFFDNISDFSRAQIDPSVMLLGSSALFLPPVQISTGDFATPSNPIIQDFELTFVPTNPGFCRIGGLRVLLVQDRGTSDVQEFEVDQATQAKVQTLKEFDIIGETWVST